MKTKSTCPTLAVILIFFFQVTDLSAQYVSFGGKSFRTQIGINVGPTFFLGDLGGNVGVGTKFVKDINPELTRSMQGAYIAFYPSPVYGFRVGAQHTQVAGDDAMIPTNGHYELKRKEIGRAHV